MKNKPFLLEIGTEEFPSSYVSEGGKQLIEKFCEYLREVRVDFGKADFLGTPRRLAVLITDVAEYQEEWEVEVKGPPLRIALDEKGNFTPAALGFARQNGVSPEELYTVKTEKGEYVALKRKEGGVPVNKLLTQGVKEILGSINFKKTMDWGVGFRFPRPIRWLVALYGEEVLSVEIAGVKSGPFSRGHRLLSPGQVEIKHPEDYIEILRKAYVIVEPKERRKKIEQNLREAAEKLDAQIMEDDELLDEVLNLVEWPSVVVGKFDERFLKLPAPVIVTAMKQHQRYFAVTDKNGDLLPYFVFIINNLQDFEEEIRPGLERVLRARLEDARFYFEEDTKRRLEDRLESLRGIIWRERLGTLYDKVQRIKGLALKLAKEEEDVDIEVLERGALLSKCDLTTEMIKDGKEFTKLEGVIGMEYALYQGEDPRVARVIFEHHLPRFRGDKLPSLKESGYLGVADRLDTLCGIFSTGYEATGSQDPLGLRRAAYGLIDIILSLGLRIAIGEALLEASIPFGNEDLAERVLSFLMERFEKYLEERMGVRYDVVDAVIGSGVMDLVNLKKRAIALKELMDKEPELFEKVIVGQKRVANILQGVDKLSPLNPSLFEKEEERVLHEVAKREEPTVREMVEKEKFKGALEHLMNLREPIDRFFDNVFVMTEDEKLRKNRLALLGYVRGIFKLYGDFSRIVVEGG